MIYFRRIKNALLTTALLIVTVLAFAQAAEGVNRQATITDSDGETIDYSSNMKVSIDLLLFHKESEQFLYISVNKR
jgi:hypothetical protein